MRAWIPIGFLCVLVLGLSPSAAAAEDEQSVAELKEQVATCAKAVAEAEGGFEKAAVSQASLDKARRDLAEARFSLAQAQGKAQEALEELKKIATYHQTAVERIMHSRRLGAASEADLDDEQRCLAEARLRIAEATNDTGEIQEQLRSIVGYHAKNVERMRGLLRIGLVSRIAVRGAEDSLAQSRAKLQTAEQESEQGK